MNSENRVSFKLYLITDRRLTAGRGLIPACEAALRAAAELAPDPWIAVQLREKDLDARPMLELALELGAICRRYRVPMLVNERVDVAMAADADGVHLPSNAITPADARELLGAGKLIGVSTHHGTEIELAAEQDADFAVFGPIFEPISKGTYGAPRGRDGLASVCAKASLPVFALGGITAERISELKGTGASGIALIGAVMAATDPAQSIRQLFDALRDWG